MSLKSIIVVVAAVMLVADADVCQAQRRARKRKPIARTAPPPPFSPQTATTDDWKTVTLFSDGTWKYRTPADALGPRPVTALDGAQVAILKDGREVFLKSDGTWEFYFLAPPVAPPRPRAEREGTLSFNPGPLFRSGDMKPVAAATFYLLDKYPGEILKAAGVKPGFQVWKPVDKPGIQGDVLNYDNVVDFEFVLGLAMSNPTPPGRQEFVTAAMAAIKPHVVQTTTADFVRETRFAAVPVGSYCLMGNAQAPKGMIFWVIEVDVKAGQNSIAIDEQWSVYGPVGGR